MAQRASPSADSLILLGVIVGGGYLAYKIWTGAGKLFDSATGAVSNAWTASSDYVHEQTRAMDDATLSAAEAALRQAGLAPDTSGMTPERAAALEDLNARRALLAAQQSADLMKYGPWGSPITIGQRAVEAAKTYYDSATLDPYDKMTLQAQADFYAKNPDGVFYDP